MIVICGEEESAWRTHNMLMALIHFLIKAEVALVSCFLIKAEVALVRSCGMSSNFFLCIEGWRACTQEDFWGGVGEGGGGTRNI